jgi:hypothetical protein
LDSERNTFGWRMRTYDYTFLDDADTPCLTSRGRSPRREVASASYGTFLEEVFFGAPCTADSGEDDETDSDEQELAEWPAALDSEEMPQEMPWRVHMVRRGETLPGLALRYGLTVEDIKRANGLAGDSFGVKTEVNIPKQTGITSANEVLRMVSLAVRAALATRTTGAPSGMAHFRQLHRLDANHGEISIPNARPPRSLRSKRSGAHDRHARPVAASFTPAHRLSMLWLAIVGRATAPHPPHPPSTLLAPRSQEPERRRDSDASTARAQRAGRSGESARGY